MSTESKESLTPACNHQKSTKVLQHNQSSLHWKKSSVIILTSGLELHSWIPFSFWPLLVVVVVFLHAVSEASLQHFFVPQPAFPLLPFFSFAQLQFVRIPDWNQININCDGWPSSSCGDALIQTEINVSKFMKLGKKIKTQV